jgi:hypothetical protein
MNECAGLFATRGIFGHTPQDDPPPFVAPIGEDTGNEEYTLADDGETLEADWMARQPPERTQLGKNGDEFSICPPISEPSSRTAFGQMAEHQMPTSTKTSVSEEADSEPESGIAWPIPEHVTRPEHIPSCVTALVDPTTIFGYGCPTTSQTMPTEGVYQNRPPWWSNVWDRTTRSSCNQCESIPGDEMDDATCNCSVYMSDSGGGS